MFAFSVWIHHKKDKSWNKKSYVKLLDIDSLSMYWQWCHSLRAKFSNLFNTHLIFFMKKDIFPMWETAHNIRGGCISFKFSPSDGELVDQWIHMTHYFVSESMLLSNNKDINGISFTPKTNYNLLKIWTVHTNKRMFTLNKSFAQLLPMNTYIFQQR